MAKPNMMGTQRPIPIKKIMLYSLLAIMIYSLAFAQDNVYIDKPWEAFRGIPFGAPESYAHSLVPGLQCQDESPYSGINLDRICKDDGFSIGTISVKYNMIGFKNDRLVHVYIQFDSENYDYIKDVFVSKYGKPTGTEEYIVQTKYGARYENEDLTWASKNVRLSLIRYSSSINTSSALFLEASQLDKIIKENRADKKKAISDF